MNLTELVVLQNEVLVEDCKLVFDIEYGEQQGILNYDLRLNEIEIVIPDERIITDFDITDDERIEIYYMLEEYSGETYGRTLIDLYDYLTYNIY